MRHLLKPFIIYSLPFVLSIFLAMPCMFQARPLKRTLLGILIAFFGIVAPLIFFFLSVFLLPDSKAGCRFGWLNCFIWAKLALTPVVIFAITAFFAVEICAVENRNARWITAGYFLGAVVSTGCLLFGLVTFMDPRELFGWGGLLFLVPFYTAAWYWIRAVQMMRASGQPAFTYLASFIFTLPFWELSWWWSHRIYQSLPETSGCFVVTAAGRGHAGLVGPFIELQRNGRILRANQQLAIFWEFERLWNSHSPQTHSTFRILYNRCGPSIAKRITSPWLADCVWLVLKPSEWLAGAIVATNRTSHTKH